MKETAKKAVHEHGLGTSNNTGVTPHTLYLRSTRQRIIVLLVEFILLLLLLAISVRAGTVEIPVRDIFSILTSGKSLEAESGTFDMTAYIVLQVRLPRIIMALVTGMVLSSGGVIMQALLQNPLASPYTLGISSGASFGAGLAIVLGTSLFGLTLVQHGRIIIAVNAFLFGLFTFAIVYGIAQIKKGSASLLILSGVAVGTIFSAGLSALKFFSDNEALKDLVVWLLGGFWGANWRNVIILSPILVISLIVLIRMGWDFNTLNAGEEVAATSGINVRRLRNISMVLVTLSSSTAIAFTGIIGFVGLVGPHITRSIIGLDNRFLILGSALTGALLLLFSDTIARTIIAPVEIPVGIITSLFGGPFFLYILLSRTKRVWN